MPAAVADIVTSVHASPTGRLPNKKLTLFHVLNQVSEDVRVAHDIDVLGSTRPPDSTSPVGTQPNEIVLGWFGGPLEAAVLPTAQEALATHGTAISATVSVARSPERVPFTAALVNLWRSGKLAAPAGTQDVCLPFESDPADFDIAALSAEDAVLCEHLLLLTEVTDSAYERAWRFHRLPRVHERLARMVLESGDAIYTAANTR
jgi:hypothetical protein